MNQTKHTLSVMQNHVEVLKMIGCHLYNMRKQNKFVRNKTPIYCQVFPVLVLIVREAVLPLGADYCTLNNYHP